VSDIALTGIRSSIHTTYIIGPHVCIIIHTFFCYFYCVLIRLLFVAFKCHFRLDDLIDNYFFLHSDPIMLQGATNPLLLRLNIHHSYLPHLYILPLDPGPVGLLHHNILHRNLHLQSSGPNH
jgi:hypothetical protein